MGASFQKKKFYLYPCESAIPAAGLVYMVFKHLVDRYNLYFAYKPSVISQNIHSTAVSYVIISVIFLQFNFVFYSAVRGSKLLALFT